MSSSEITGWISLLLLAISFCTPIRSPRLNLFIGGYRFQLLVHKWVGLGALMFMVAHLIMLILDFSLSLRSLLDLTDIAISSGWIAFTCTTVTSVAALRFRRMPYRRWRYIHLVLILAYLGAVLHSFLVLEPRIALEWLSMTLAAGIGGVGIVCCLWIPQFKNFGVSYKIVDQVELRPNLFKQVLSPIDRKRMIRFTAGQFIFVRFNDSRFSNLWHPFTVVRFSDSGEIELLIKARGRDTNILRDVVLPTPVNINGPFGKTFWGSDKPQLWIAYGVGIAIFLAATRSFPDDLASPVHLLYCEKNEDRIVFADEFDSVNIRKSNFTWTKYFGEGQDVIEQMKGELVVWSKKYRLFRICGHPGFQVAAKRILVESGINRNNIILEGVF